MISKINYFHIADIACSLARKRSVKGWSGVMPPSQSVLERLHSVPAPATTALEAARPVSGEEKVRPTVQVETAWEGASTSEPTQLSPAVSLGDTSTVKYKMLFLRVSGKPTSDITLKFWLLSYV